MIFTSDLKNYAFTIQIPAFKKIYYNDIYQPYKELSTLEQEDYIYKLVRHAISDFDTEHFEIKFEKHKDGRTHAHGSLYNISSDNLEEFIDSVCFQIGVKSPKQKRECCFCIPILLSYERWNMYLNKDQPQNTKDYSSYLFGKL